MSRPIVRMKIALLHPGARVPEYGHDEDAGCDAFAPGPDTLVIPARGRGVVPLGIAVQVPRGYEVQARSRSGMARKHGVRVTHGLGTIDCGFTGELCALLTNEDSTPYKIEPGDRVLQLILAPVPKILFEVVEKLDDSERGAGGWGSTGR